MPAKRSDSMDPDKRARLFREAAAEFAAHGFRRASLNRIISRAGLSKSSFYHFFANKDDLFRQTLEGALAPIMGALDGFDPDALTADTYWSEVARVAAEMAHMASRSAELVPVGRMFYRCFETPEDRALTEEPLSLVTAWLERLIRRGQQLGQVRRDLPESLMIDVAMGMGMAMDRWMLAHWDEMSAPRREALSARAFGLFQSMFMPPAGDDAPQDAPLDAPLDAAGQEGGR